MKIIIVGGGEIGYRLAENLLEREGNRVTIIESDAERCRLLAEHLDALVLHGDGTAPSLLRKAGIGAETAVVATTGSDAINTVVAMLGKRFGVATIIVRLENMGLRAACQEIGVTHIVAPRMATAAEMTAYLYGLHNLDFSLVARGGLELVQLSARAVHGRKVHQLTMPEGSLIVAIIRGAETVLVPRGITRLERDDELMVLAENPRIIDRVRECLEL